MRNITKLVVFSLLVLSLFAAGCTEEQLKPDSLSLGYNRSQYGGAPVYQGFMINLGWEL